MDLHGKRVTVMGLGTFGGGVGAVRFLTSRGAAVTVTDLQTAENLRAPLAEIADLAGVVLHLGGHRAEDFQKADLLVVSPAVPKDSEYLQMAVAAGVPISSEMNLFWEHNRGRTLCITGSNGKSTTAALVHALLTGGAAPVAGDGFAPTAPAIGGAGRCWLGGNIGKSLLPVVEEIDSDDWVVLELSSFQLEDLTPLRPNPHVAIVTNFTPNHLDRHGSIEAYRQAKQNILRWQTADRIAILNQDDADVAGWETAAQKFWFGRDDEGRQGAFGTGFDAYKRRMLFRKGMREQVLPLSNWLSLPGVHNFMNALAATCAALLLDADIADIQSGLSRFKGLPHRLEFVAELAERRFYNDSKATTPEAALLGIRAFSTSVVLLAGGYDKGVDLTDMARGIASSRVKAVALMGQTAERLGELIRGFDSKQEILLQTHGTFDAAFAWAAAQSNPGEVVLLSPGCASYDWFSNYEARGAAFRQLVEQWTV